MEINNTLVKHYIQYNTYFLSKDHKKELSLIIKNDNVLNNLAIGIKQDYETKKWKVSFTDELNSQSIYSILKP